jgi:molybdopterin synthase catalytic subunit
MIQMVTGAGVHKKGAFSLSDLIESARRDPAFSEAGAVAVFVGVVRGSTEKGERVVGLKLEAYEEKANAVLIAICSDLKKKSGIVDVQIHHLLGEFSVGEEIVYVLVAGSHRRETFDVLRLAVDRYKQEAPIFKKERVISKDGRKKVYWVGESKEDDDW